MFNALLHRFAEDAGPPVHIAPGGIFEINGVSITNSMIFNAVVALIMIITFTVIAKRMTLRPKGGLTQFVEVGAEFVVSVLEGSLGSREKAVKYAPYFTTIFFFIFTSSFLGLLPGVGEAFTYNDTPVFRAFTADLNGTLAAALVSMTMVQYFAIQESGFVGHLRHYFAGKLWNPATYLAGIYEVLNEFIRMFSLALRLFLNIAIGEIIISVFAYLGKFAAPITALPFLTLELGVCILQSYIFVMLCSTYLALATTSHGGEDHGAEDEAPAAVGPAASAKAN